MGSNPSAGTSSKSFARVAQLEEAADLKSAFLMSSNLSTRTKDSGALGKPGSSRLIFNQEMRGFESHTPCQQDFGF